MTLGSIIRRLFGITDPPKGSRASRPSTQGGPTPSRGVPLLEYRSAAAQPTANVQWRRESIRVPRTAISVWSQVTRRQKLLILLAFVALAAMGISALRGAAVPRTIPLQVQGFYVADRAPYAGLAMELRAHLVAFKTTDTTQPPVIRRVLSVSSKGDPHGTIYKVEYEADGQPVELEFRYEGGPLGELILMRQQHVRWRRLQGTMLPMGY